MSKVCKISYLNEYLPFKINSISFKPDLRFFKILIYYKMGLQNARIILNTFIVFMSRK